jgi:hypothetical protein
MNWLKSKLPSVNKTQKNITQKNVPNTNVKSNTQRRWDIIKTAVFNNSLKKPPYIFKSNICSRNESNQYNEINNVSNLEIVNESDCKMLDVFFQCEFPTIFTTPTCIPITIDNELTSSIPKFWMYRLTPHELFIREFRDKCVNLLNRLLNMYDKRNNRSKQSSGFFSNISNIKNNTIDYSDKVFFNNDKSAIDNMNMSFNKYYNCVKLFESTFEKTQITIPERIKRIDNFECPEELLCSLDNKTKRYWIYNYASEKEKKTPKENDTEEVKKNKKLFYKYDSGDSNSISYADDNDAVLKSHLNVLNNFVKKIENINNTMKDINNDIYIFKMVHKLLNEMDPSTEDQTYQREKGYPKEYYDLQNDIDKFKDEHWNRISKSIINIKKSNINQCSEMEHFNIPKDLLKGIKEKYTTLMNKYFETHKKLLPIFISELEEQKEYVKNAYDGIDKTIKENSWINPEKNTPANNYNIETLKQLTKDIITLTNTMELSQLKTSKISYIGLYDIKESNNNTLYYPWCTRSNIRSAINVTKGPTSVLSKGVTYTATGIAIFGLGAIGTAALVIPVSVAVARNKIENNTNDSFSSAGGKRTNPGRPYRLEYQRSNKSTRTYRNRKHKHIKKRSKQSRKNAKK